MPVSLPLAIENYLRESGFSGTEIIVLKKLLEENFLTVRELAAKSGKGNGVIDAALKKLINRNIVSKEIINGFPKYKVIDPQALVHWTKKNLTVQTEMLIRKHQSFAQFMENLTVAKNLPEIEHFSGEEGMKKALEKMLESRAPLLTYMDPANESESPLADFLLQYSRRRQVHGIFQQIIAPNTIASRRFRSRDPYEYRKTILVRSEDFPMSFTKIIAGDVVACMDFKTLQASLIRFAKLAESECTSFEKLFNEQIKRDRDEPNTKETPGNNTSEFSVKHSININLLQKISTIFLILLIAFWTILFLTETRSGFFNYLYSFLFGLIPLLSGIAGLMSAKRWGGYKNDIGKAIIFMSIGIFAWGCGETIWSYYNFFYGVPAPYPSFADLGFAPSIFFYSLGMIFLSDAMGAKAGLKNIYAKIFVVVAPLIILAVSYYALIIIARGGVLVPPGETSLKTILDIVYPLGNVLGLTIAVLISGLSFKYMGGRYTMDIVALLLGLAVMFIGDFVFSYTTTVGTYYNGNFGDLILTIGVFLLSFGVLGFAQDKKSEKA